MEKEELDSLKQRYQSLLQQCQQFQSQCKELTEEEMKEVTGGFFGGPSGAMPGLDGKVWPVI